MFFLIFGCGTAAHDPDAGNGKKDTVPDKPEGFLYDNRIDTLYDQLIPLADSFSNVCMSPSCDNFIHSEYISIAYQIIYSREENDTAFEQGHIAIKDTLFSLASLFNEKIGYDDVDFYHLFHHLHFADRDIIVLNAHSRLGCVLPKARLVMLFELFGKKVKAAGVLNYAMPDPEVWDCPECFTVRGDKLFIKVYGPALRRDTIPYPQDSVVYEFRDGKLLPIH